jgi:hypothetical protein
VDALRKVVIPGYSIAKISGGSTFYQLPLVWWRPAFFL